MTGRFGAPQIFSSTKLVSAPLSVPHSLSRHFIPDLSGIDIFAQPSSEGK
jgi:hypothetical protein